MENSIKRAVHLLFWGLFCLSANAQDSFVVQDIRIEGNRRTKEKVILRELDFVKGDSIEISFEALEKINENRLLSTGLFNMVDISRTDSLSANTDILISLTENWYIFPGIVFSMADRNFNVWWTEQNRDFSRVNYGAKLSHSNLTGAKDPLWIKAHLGFTRNFELNYLYPYLNKKNTLGIGGGIFYSLNKTIPYITIDNKTQWHRAEDERSLLKRFRTGMKLTYRPTVQLYNALRLEYHRNWVDELVMNELNPNYFLNGRNSIRFFFAEYDVQYDQRIYNLYPKGGYLLFGNIKKEGFGIFKEYNNLSLSIGAEKYQPITKKLVLATRIKGKINLNRNPVSFANNTGLGWDSDIVSGYELYVIDGTDFVFALNSLRYSIHEGDYPLFKWFPYQFRDLNLKLFLRLNFDTAYVNEPTFKASNELNNRWIFGYGPAVDVILFNNYRLSFEYSFNDLGESGLFINSNFLF